METALPLVTNDAAVLSMLALILGFVFYTESSEHPFWKKFYTYVPARHADDRDLTPIAA
jgi:hypothetical protein